MQLLLPSSLAEPTPTHAVPGPRSTQPVSAGHVLEPLFEEHGSPAAAAWALGLARRAADAESAEWRRALIVSASWSKFNVPLL
eukprot:4983862-Karenia_brevis.AAC.1